MIAGENDRRATRLGRELVPPAQVHARGDRRCGQLSPRWSSIDAPSIAAAGSVAAAVASSSASRPSGNRPRAASPRRRRPASTWCEPQKRDLRPRPQRKKPYVITRSCSHTHQRPAHCRLALAASGVEGAAVVGAIHVEQQHVVGIDLGRHRRRRPVVGEQLPAVAAVPALARRRAIGEPHEHVYREHRLAQPLHDDFGPPGRL